VYDVDFWSTESHEGLRVAYVDLAKRQIMLPVIEGRSSHLMECILTQMMAHASTGTTSNKDFRFMAEMERLAALGAPVWRGEEDS
jgi:hypothetical protein